MLQPRSICFNLGQFDFFYFCGKQKNIFGAFDLLFILLLLFISTLLTSPTIPSLPSQHLSPYSFYLNAYMYRVSLEPPTFGFPLDSCPDALPLSHGDLDASSTIFLITYTVVVNFLKLFKSDILIKENIPPVITLQYMYLCPNYIQTNLTITS